MPFLTRAKAKGNVYMYLRAYHSSSEGFQGKRYIYSFGRAEKAYSDMKRWFKDYRAFPLELIELGCTKEDLKGWIRTIETGETKTGRKIANIL
ncbi:hypothetical protein [Rossellomorea marisflavi]|uniref:hypothetical protein n=1 Tax=Rossellomorea marisflavi TaxID=189381 RepID=UPI003D2EE327